MGSQKKGGESIEARQFYQADASAQLPDEAEQGRLTMVSQNGTYLTNNQEESDQEADQDPAGRRT